VKKCEQVNEFLWTVRVYYEDTDAGGVVFYANYLKFMERARTEWLRSAGFQQSRLAEEEGVVFAVRRVQLDFLRPARLDDRLDVSVQQVNRRRASMEIEQEVRRGREVLCRGKVEIVCVDAQRFRPHVIPDTILAEIAHGD